jgi:hypothetical protein
MREEVMELKKEIEELKEESFAMEILADYKRQNKRLFVMWIITFLTLVALSCYTLYLVNDIGTIETTVTQENSDGYNNYIGNDGDITNGKASN